MIKCDMGTDFLVVRLIVVLIASAVLIATASACIEDAVSRASIGHARAEIGQMVELARLEYSTGTPEGDGYNVDLKVPRSVRKAVFGCSPDELEHCMETGRSASIYYIEFQDGHVDTYLTDIKFSCGDRSTGNVYDSPVVLYPGKYSLDIRTVIVNGNCTLAIYGGSGC